MIGSAFGGSNGAFIADAKQAKLNDSSVSLNDQIVLNLTNLMHKNLMKFYEGPAELLKRFESIDKLLSGVEAKRVADTILECLSSENTIESLEQLTVVCDELKVWTYRLYALVLSNTMNMTRK